MIANCRSQFIDFFLELIEYIVHVLPVEPDACRFGRQLMCFHQSGAFDGDTISIEVFVSSDFPAARRSSAFHGFPIE
jgi:hypothetical protein